MFLTDKLVIDKLNTIYSNNIVRGQNGALELPSKDDLLVKLRNHETILVYYLTATITSELPPKDDSIPEVNVNLEKFFVYPFGDKLWVDDAALQLLSDNNYLIPQDICNEVIDARFENYKKIKVEKDDLNNLSDFCNHLNKLYTKQFVG